MKELKTEFQGRGEVKGFDFKQIEKTETAYIYEVKSSSSNSTHYEVFKRKENTMYDCVSYPTSKAFGIWAKSTTSKERAYELLKSMQ